MVFPLNDIAFPRRFLYVGRELRSMRAIFSERVASDSPVGTVLETLRFFQFGLRFEF